jgi:hypothetical protein
MRNQVLFVALGVVSGVIVTLRAHRAPTSPGWDKRVGRTRLRRSDLPVGFTAALLTALGLRGAGKNTAARLVAAWGIGAGIGAVGTGIAEPLEPASR